MTEVPDHLLARSKARRAALGLGGDDGDGGGAVVPAAASAAPAEATAAAKPAAAAGPPPEDKKLEAERAARAADVARRKEALKRNRIPIWATPVLFSIPVWGFLYAGTFGERAHHDELPPTPAELYAANCASCHGANGEGGAGPKLADGEVLLTFPDTEEGEAAHIEWVENGSQTRRGEPYGDPNRPGGQRVAASGGMPAFAGTLTPEEIEAVVAYERDEL